MKHRGKQKGQGLSRASSGDADHVQPGETNWEADRLNGSWLCKFASFDALHNVRGEVALLKLEDRARALKGLIVSRSFYFLRSYLVVALFNDADFFFLRPVTNGRAASVGDILVFPVEVLLEWHKVLSFPINASKARSGIGELSSAAAKTATESAAAAKAAASSA